jgi:hypothetical protein
MEYSMGMQLVTCSLLLAALSASALPAQDSFVGNWKLSLAKSKLTGQSIEIQEMSPGTFMFKEDEHSDFIFADGLDHLTHFGDSMAITIKDAHTWAITYKRGDHVTMDTVWKVSPDGQKLTWTATGTRPNGQHFDNKMILKRAGGTTGLAGEWEAIDFELSSPHEIDIAPYGKDGHFITFPGRMQTIRMKFDGKPYREEGPTVPDGLTSSGRRIDPRTIETTERLNGKIRETATAKISEDGKTQTIVVIEPDDKTPVTLVYDREVK